EMDEDENYIKEVALYEENKKELFYDKLKFYYIEIPKFRKSDKELSTHLDKWLYILKHLVEFTDIPEFVKEDEVLEEVFDVAEFLKLSKEEQFAYQKDLKARLDFENTIDYAKETAREEGREEGLKEGREKGLKEGERKKAIEIAQNLLNIGVDTNTISKSTGLSIEEIEKLKQ
ncbi:MAG: hypothetical protein DSY40_02700, partial [Nautilia sp.]